MCGENRSPHFRNRERDGWRHGSQNVKCVWRLINKPLWVYQSRYFSIAQNTRRDRESWKQYHSLQICSYYQSWCFHNIIKVSNNASYSCLKRCSLMWIYLTLLNCILKSLWWSKQKTEALQYSSEMYPEYLKLYNDINYNTITLHFNCLFSFPSPALACNFFLIGLSISRI